MPHRKFAMAPAFAAALAFLSASLGAAEPVVVYTSVDDVFARPIVRAFEQQTGIPIRLVPDTEETKSTGLLNRLLAERKRPRADVFWSGDPVRAAILKQRGISEAYRSVQAAGIPSSFVDPQFHWTGFSARVRVLLVNTRRMQPDRTPRSVLELADPRYRDRGCIANPLFGTTSMHAAALFQALGDAKARDFFEGMRNNGVRVLSSNGEVRRAVGAGECGFGVVDTDDAAEAVRDGLPVEVSYPDQDGIGAVLVPNAAVLIKDGPNPPGGRRFIDFLLSAETEAALASGDAAQLPLRTGIPGPPGMVPVSTLKTMKLDYSLLASQLETLSRGFLKAWVDSARR
ncbi:MAG: extracellular solute-binding protein [Burkholderiales bacterium]|nr:extracellular solute-binding protein [Burkholderiales bacterium]